MNTHACMHEHKCSTSRLLSNTSSPTDNQYTNQAMAKHNETQHRKQCVHQRVKHAIFKQEIHSNMAAALGGCSAIAAAIHSTLPHSTPTPSRPGTGSISSNVQTRYVSLARPIQLDSRPRRITLSGCFAKFYWGHME